MKVVILEAEPRKGEPFVDLSDSHGLIPEDRQLMPETLDSLDDVVIIRHGTFNSRKAIQRTLDIARATIAAFLNGQSKNPVT